MTAKFMQSHFSSHFLSPPSCCSPSVLPLFTHLDLVAWALVWSPSVKDDTTVGRILMSCAQDWTGHPESLCIHTVSPRQFSCVSALVCPPFPYSALLWWLYTKKKREKIKHLFSFATNMVFYISTHIHHQVLFVRDRYFCNTLNTMLSCKDQIVMLPMKHRRLQCETWYQLLRVRWFGV